MNTTDPIGARQLRIDGTYGLEPNKASEDKEGAAQSPKATGVGAATEVVSSQERLIAAAGSADEVNARAVEEARALLASGQLDTPEAAKRAAQNILDLGL
jgi:hypothetical protein